MFDPIAGHGQANAALMTSAGLAWLAGSPAALTGTIRGLALVQPLLVCDLLFAVLISVMLRHRRPDGITVAGVLGSAAGLACFVAVAGPSGGVTTVSFPSVLPLIVALGAVLIGCLTAARLNPWGTRAIWLALACGACFGVTAFLLKLVPGTLLQGSATRSGSGRCTSWSSSGLSGSCSTQNALQAGQLVAPVLAVITAADPLFSIGIAHVWLHETIAAAPVDLAAESVSLAVMTGGIIVLAHRAPQAARQGFKPPSRRSEQPAIDRSTI
jgi:hypothetical protein